MEQSPSPPALFDQLCAVAVWCLSANVFFKEVAALKWSVREISVVEEDCKIYEKIPEKL